MPAQLIEITNTNFVFERNFAGDPKKDRFGARERKAKILIGKPLADQLASQGLYVSVLKPRNPEDEPHFAVEIKVHYNPDDPSRDPKVYLVSDPRQPETLLNAQSIGVLDNISTQNVNVIVSVYNNKSLYVRTMYVEQSVSLDPFAARYAERRAALNGQ